MAERLWRPHELAAYATLPWESRGRLHAEREDPTRSPFQRDRDRIIHTTAFRRLEYKTQVFIHYEGDYFRTRLTHSIEVAQLARSVARALGLNDDLTEQRRILWHLPMRLLTDEHQRSNRRQRDHSGNGMSNPTQHSTTQRTRPRRRSAAELCGMDLCRHDEPRASASTAHHRSL